MGPFGRLLNVKFTLPLENTGSQEEVKTDTWVLKLASRDDEDTLFLLIHLHAFLVCPCQEVTDVRLTWMLDGGMEFKCSFLDRTPWNFYWTNADGDPAATEDENRTDIFQTNPSDACGTLNKKNTDEENSCRLRENAAHWRILRLIHDLV